MKTILVICIGNICRSPMAEGILANSLPNLVVESAGIGALIGERADQQSCLLMHEKGIDISSHIARQVSQSVCKKADLILVMDQEQRAYLEYRYPQTKGKVFLLDEDEADIPDPYRRNRQAFEHALVLIERGAEKWTRRIKKLTEQDRQFT